MINIISIHSLKKQHRRLRQLQKQLRAAPQYKRQSVRDEIKRVKEVWKKSVDISNDKLLKNMKNGLDYAKIMQTNRPDPFSAADERFALSA